MTTDELLLAYHAMSFLRAFELRLDALFLRGAVAGTTHLCIGQEACSIGVGHALTNDDAVFSNHRGHGHLIGRGGDPLRLMAEICGNERGYSQGRGGSQHVAVNEIGFLGTHGITAGTIPLATGVALHKKRTGEPGLGCVFFGEGATGEGIFHESLNLAALWQLPVLYVCENNEYAMSSAHRLFSPVADVATRASAFGMEALIVDGNDVGAVYDTVCELRKRVIAESRPVLLELKTYRISGHSRGDQCVYRSREEEDAARDRDPLLRARQLLQQAELWDLNQEQELSATTRARLDEMQRALQIPLEGE